MLRSVLSANRVKNQEEKASSDTRDLAVPFRSVSVLTRGMAASIVFYFAFLRFGHISGVLGKIFQILKPIIYGFVLAYLLNPLMKMVENFNVKLLKGKIKKEERLK